MEVINSNISNQEVQNNSSEIVLKKVEPKTKKYKTDNSERGKRRIFYKISDQLFDDLFSKYDFLEKERLNKEMFLMDNSECVYFKNKSILNKVNYIKFLYN